MKTPMIQQYEKMKEIHSDAILLFRIGDFYECFDGDAKILARVLGITLTGRGKQETRIPMAGIPHHALKQYLPKLVNSGYKVAIAEQLSEPKPGTIVDRDVVKIITAGTIFDEDILSSEKNNFIASIFVKTVNKSNHQIYSLAYADVSTGLFETAEYIGTQLPNDLMEELFRVNPAEIIILKEQSSLLNNISENFNLTFLNETYKYNQKEAIRIIKKQFNVLSLKGFGIEDSEAIQYSVSLLIKYFLYTQKTALSHITSLKKLNSKEYMVLDQTTIRNLEIINPISSFNEKSLTLFTAMNFCLTAMGQRLLRSWLLRPLINNNKIINRQNDIKHFLANSNLNLETRESLKEIPDLERIVARISIGSANARDLIYLANGLNQSIDIIKKLSKSKYLNKYINLDDLNIVEEEVILKVENAIKSDPPISITEGGIIKSGFDNQLDELRRNIEKAKSQIAELKSKEIKRTGISSLKVKYNKVFGYYIEVSKSNLDKVPADYIRKQTLVNAERFITPDLKKWEEIVINSEQTLAELEYGIFNKIREGILFFTSLIQRISNEISYIDVITNLAFIASERNYTCPKLTLNANKTIIKNGRHPVIELSVEKSFIANDVEFTQEKQEVIVLTGPNMSGKSTYIRQVAILILLAQTGSFIPADFAIIELTDRIFTRVGASDNLSGGESTFMVEMSETANILNNATDKSLLILDEVGRGTSTYDGIAIAWSIIEYIIKTVRARTLFATHYHELTKLSLSNNVVQNYHLSVLEDDSGVKFQRKVVKGGTDRSYGINVAELAGVPKMVIERAFQLLTEFEETKSSTKSNIISSDQLSLKIDKSEEKIRKLIKNIDIKNITPLEALNELAKIQKDIE